MNILFKFFLVLSFSFFCSNFIVLSEESDHDKAIKAVNEGEILSLNQILESVNRNFNGRVISVNLKDNEGGLFGWVYDIMIIDSNNNVRNLRVDAGTATILSVHSGED